jgi:hypothetical protein
MGNYSTEPTGSAGSAIADAERAGFDLSLIEANLSYSYDKRALLHDAALTLALEMEKIGRELRGDAHPASSASKRR